MRAVVLRDGNTVTMEERPALDGPKAGEVLLRSRHCGICGTDLHASNLTELFVPDVVMGHEFAGEVIAVAPGVADWKPGDRATVNPNGDVCGTCLQCREGRYNLCRVAVLQRAVGVQRDGGMQTHVSLPAKVLNRLPDAVSTLQGAWTEPLATVIRAVRVSGFQLGARAVILGAGPIGLLAVQAVTRAGASEVCVVEPSSYRRDMARRLGAHRTIDPQAHDPVELFERELAPPQFVFECSGHPKAIGTAISIVLPQGVVTVVGVCPEPLDLAAEELVLKEVVVRGSVIYVDEFPMAIRLLEQGAFDVESLTSQVLPLDSFEQGFERLRRAEDAVKIVLAP